MLRELIAYKKTLNFKRKIAPQRRTALGFVHGEKHAGLSDTPQRHVYSKSGLFSSSPKLRAWIVAAQKLLLGRARVRDEALRALRRCRHHESLVIEDSAGYDFTRRTYA